MTGNQLVFVSLVSTLKEIRAVNLLIKSIRSFAGEFSTSDIWVFCPADSMSLITLDDKKALLVKIACENSTTNFPFRTKVFACAAAELLARGSKKTLVWVDSSCVFLNAPHQYFLEGNLHAAFRPVHIKNVGQISNKPLDPYWKDIYSVTGYQDPGYSVVSFVDSQTLRPYFNMHTFSINPELRVLNTWRDLFIEVINHPLQHQDLIQDELHRTFFHQALLSALVATTLRQDQIRILTPDYSYPFHLHDSIPAPKKVRLLDELICLTYDDHNFGLKSIENITESKKLQQLFHR